MIDVERIAPAARAQVERQLDARVRAEDGAFGSTTLRALLGDRGVGRTRVTQGGRALHGVLLDWPGLQQPQMLHVSRPLWDALDLPVVDPPAELR